MTSEKIYTVYKITNLCNGKSYIGVTHKPLEIRWYWHVNASKKPIPKLLFHQEIKKFGAKSFAIETLSIAGGKQLAWEIEKKFITEFNTMHPNGYNLTGGGAGEILVPEIWAKLIGRKMSREAVEKSRLKKIGMKRTDEQKRKISENRIGKGLDNRSAAKLTKDDVAIIKGLIQEGISNSDIAKKFNMDASTISRIKTANRWPSIVPKRINGDVI